LLLVGGKEWLKNTMRFKRFTVQVVYMTDSKNLTWEDLDKFKKCEECKIKAPKRQVENLNGLCERCKMEGVVKTEEGDTMNPELNKIDEWRLKSGATKKKSIQ